MRPLYHLLSAFVFATCWLTLPTKAFAQNSFGFVNNVTSVPVPGVGHDYIHDLGETVNPANGSLSVRIEAPRPKERGLNYPLYAFMYDSTQQFAVQYQENTTGQTYACGQDSAGDNPAGSEPTQPLNCVLSISFPFQSIAWPAGRNGVLSGPNSILSANQTYSRWYLPAYFQTCNLVQNYSYEDPYGVIHDLGVYKIVSGPNTSGCSYLGIYDNPIGGDEQYKIVVQDPYSNLNINSMMIDTHGNSVQVVDGTPVASLTLEDTNGNFVNGTGRSGSYQSFQPWGDALAYPKTASRTFAGGATYNYTWGTATTSYNPSSVDETLIEYGTDNLCNGNANFKFGYTGAGNSNPVVLKMQDPDGLYHTFAYDSHYGFLNKITYPTGAWVEYTWGVNPMSDATGWTTPARLANNYNDPVYISSGYMANTACVFEHVTPAIVKRVVSYDGVNQAFEQDFSYSTVWEGTGYQGQFWNSKQTVVITKDLLSPELHLLKQYITTYPGSRALTRV